MSKPVSLKRKEKSLIILDALLNGITVELEGFKYKLGIDKTVCIVSQVWKNSELIEEEHLMNSFIELSTFIYFCDQMTEEELIQVVFSLSMKKLQEEKDAK